jgi:DNA-binding transcriptional ArsR family regulator
VNGWQDGCVIEPSAPDADAVDGSRQHPPVVSNVDLLKALADPLRLRLLHALIPGSGAALPTMSVKELAAELGEPQTKLYRHVKHLESAGLIRAVASRVVSGIVEQRYQACRADLIVGDDLTDQEKASPEAEAMAAAALEMFRGQFFAASRARQSDQTASGAEPRAKPLLAVGDGRVSVAKAAAVREQLVRMLEDVGGAEGNWAADADSGEAGEEILHVNLLVGYFPWCRPPPT